MQHRLIRIMIGVVTVIMVAGCAHFSFYPASGTEESLRERVEEEWTAKTNKDSETIYNLTTDEYKKKVPRKSYHFHSNVPVKGYSIDELEILDGGTRAIVHVTINVRHMGFDFNLPLKEEWLWQRGSWRLNLKHEDRKIPQSIKKEMPQQIK